MKYYLKPDGHGEMSGQPYYKVIKRGILWDSTYATCLTQTEAELLCDLQNKINPFSDGAHTQSTINNLARIKDLEKALADSVSTYLGSDKLVTAERIETWQAVLKG